jgi:ferredoxin
MSVYIKFEPQAESGLIAEGTNLLNAARRLGVSFPTDCRGLDECDSCLVVVKEGASLLSSPSTAELERLGHERLSSNQRLACHATVERSGDLVLVTVPRGHHEETPEDAAENLRKEFRDLPLKRKLKKLAEFEAVTAFEALTELAQLPFTVGEKVLTAVADLERKRRIARGTQNSDEQCTSVESDGNSAEHIH